MPHLAGSKNKKILEKVLALAGITQGAYICITIISLDLTVANVSVGEAALQFIAQPFHQVSTCKYSKSCNSNDVYLLQEVTGQVHQHFYNITVHRYCPYICP